MGTSSKIGAENLEKRRGCGRPKGSRNKTTATAKAIIEEAADKLGGAKRLVAWAREAPENERAFWATIYPRLLPLQVNADVAHRTVSAQPLSPEQWAERHAEERVH